MSKKPPYEFDGAITAINVTPLVDVCLVLVIIFMSIAPFALKSGIRVFRSSSSTATGQTAVSENVTVKMDKTGVLMVNGKQVQLDALPNAIIGALQTSRDGMVIVTADSENVVGDVVQILDIAKQCGAAKLALMRNE
ncbi:MAG: biopolymer transporter ExbD [Elusimicrobiales bacterium]